MKRKVLMSLVLATALSLSTQVPSARAATTAAESSKEETAQKDDTSQSKSERIAKKKSTKKKGVKKDGTSKPSKGSLKHGSKEKVTEPEGAIGKDKAKKIALSDAKVTSDQAGKVKSRVSKLEDGTVVYSIHFTYNSKLYSYRINATSGDIVEKNTKDITDDTSKPLKGRGHHGKKAGKIKTDKTTSDKTEE